MMRERRRASRRMPEAVEALSRMRLRAGRELHVIDVSASGALVEGDTRLLPGTHVDVHVVTAGGRVLVRSRIVRAFVSAVWSDRVLYRGALAFDHPVDVGGPAPRPAEYAFPGVLQSGPDPPGIHYPTAAA